MKKLFLFLLLLALLALAALGAINVYSYFEIKNSKDISDAKIFSVTSNRRHEANPIGLEYYALIWRAKNLKDEKSLDILYARAFTQLKGAEKIREMLKISDIGRSGANRFWAVNYYLYKLKSSNFSPKDASDFLGVLKFSHSRYKSAMIEALCSEKLTVTNAELDEALRKELAGVKNCSF